MSNLNRETVLSVHHWTDRLFSFRTTRDPARQPPPEPPAAPLTE